MMRGGTPAVAIPRSRAIGLNPYLPTARSLAISSATAPSLMPDALPAVTLPSGLTTPFSLASASSVVSRGCSSLLTTVSPFLPGMVTATISPSKNLRANAAE